MNIGVRLKEERLRLGLSQAELGSIGDVSKTTQLLYEGGDRVPDANYLAAAAKKGMDINYVITGARESDMSASKFDRELLAAILDGIETWATKRKRPVAGATKAELAALFYSQFFRSGQIDADLMAGHLKLVA